MILTNHNVELSRWLQTAPNRSAKPARTARLPLWYRSMSLVRYIIGSDVLCHVIAAHSLFSPCSKIRWPVRMCHCSSTFFCALQFFSCCFRFFSWSSRFFVSYFFLYFSSLLPATNKIC